MRAQELDTVATTNGFYAMLAAKDAQRINSNYKSTYSDSAIKTVVGAEALLTLAYKFKDSYINYRKNGISIKLNNALVRERKALREVESILEEKGFSKRTSAQGIIYSLARN
jgi:hypothetical protein